MTVPRPSPSSLKVRSTRSGACYGAAFAPDGQSVVCVGRNVVLWETARKRRLASSHPLSHPSDVAFSPSGEEIVVKNTSGACVVLDPKTSAVVRGLGGAKFGEGTPVAFATDGTLIDASWNGHVLGRDVQTGETTFYEHNDVMITEMARDLERDVFAYAAYSRADETDTIWLRTWPFADNAPVPLLQQAGGLNLGSLALHGDRLAAVNGLQLQVMSSATGEVIAQREFPVAAGVRGLAWWPDGRAVLAALEGGFALYDGQLQELWALEKQYACEVAVAADGSRVVLASWTDSLIAEPA